MFVHNLKIFVYHMYTILEINVFGVRNKCLAPPICAQYKRNYHKFVSGHLFQGFTHWKH